MSEDNRCQASAMDASYFGNWENPVPPCNEEAEEDLHGYQLCKGCIQSFMILQELNQAFKDRITDPGTRVILQQAFYWKCPRCQEVNFVKAVEAKLSDEDMQEAKTELGLQPWQEGALLWAPDHVHCGKCKEAFLTQDGDEEV